MENSTFFKLHFQKHSGLGKEVAGLGGKCTQRLSLRVWIFLFSVYPVRHPVLTAARTVGKLFETTELFPHAT